MIELTEVRRRAAAAEDRFPLLTLAEFFEGNTVQDSIAPNEWGYGRPPLADFLTRFREIEARPEVAWVRVQIHEETFEEPFGVLSGEAVALCTTASAEECEAWTSGLDSTGVSEGYVYPDDWFTDVPEIPAGARVYSVIWD